MKIQKYTLRQLLYSLFIFASLVIILDFIIPGRVYIEDIIDVKAEHQQYYNAARNSHYSYKVFTSNHNFYVSEDFAKAIKGHPKIQYTVSRLFSEVNSYGLITSERKSIYSLRFLAGFIIPLIVIVVMGLAYRYEREISILVFVMQVVLIANLIFLMI